MMRSLRRIKNRIRSIENTEKVTRALEMISVVKLNRIDNILYAIRPYLLKLESIVNNFINSTEQLSSPFLEERPHRQNLGLCLITSDSGLCGMYNDNIIRLAEEFIRIQGKDKIKLIAIGRKGLNYFKKRNLQILNSYIGLNGRYSDKISDEITNALTNIFLSGEVCEVYVAYTHYETALRYKPMIKKLLNIEAPGSQEIEYILEPNKERILEELLPRYISMQTRLFLLEAFSCEHAARTVAMKTATDNANELLERLILQRNKARQANITQEIMEIISSTEALKG
jgi:F-type H+-transporting ATPase subunit gamma